MEESWPTFHDMMVAYKSCRLHKPVSTSQIQFELRLGENLSLLLREIHSGKYHPSPSKCFVVTHPKPREIFAAEFRDRVIHHLIVSQLEPIWEKKFIYSSFACRIKKGAHGAIKYTQQKVRELSKGGSTSVWALQLDIARFFVTIDRPILCALLLKHCNHPTLCELIQIVYGHDSRMGAKRSGSPQSFKLIPHGKSWFDQGPVQGIPIGNLSSQLGANIYLTALDHFIQRELKPKAYLRYMDDLLLLDLDPEKLKMMAAPLDQWLLTHRGQRLNPEKTRLIRLSDGISYLGYRLKQVDFPSQPLQVFSEPIKKWRWIVALKRFESAPFPVSERPHPLAPRLTPKRTVNEIASLNSRLGDLGHCRSYRLCEVSLDHFIRATTQPKGMPSDFANPWCPFTLKRGYRAIRLK